MNAAARARLEGWKLSLLDLMTSNPLLDAVDGRTSFSLPASDPMRLASALASGASFGFETGMDPCAQDDALCRVYRSLGAQRTQLGVPRPESDDRDPGRVSCHTLDAAFSPPRLRTARNASWGISTLPTSFILALPSFCFSNSLRFRVTSPP